MVPGLRALAEQADRPLRSPGETEGRERLQAEAGNLAAAVRWYLAHDRGPLPHLIRVLWLFWTLEDLEREAWPWVQQLLPAAGTLDPQPRAELAPRRPEPLRITTRGLVYAVTSAIIAGGGIAGLTAGRALLRAGVEVVGAEKADSIRAAGAALSLRPMR